MESLLVYLLKVNIAIGLLYLLYRACFTGDTFFHLRRIVLLSIFVFAFVSPVLHITDRVPAFLSFLQPQAGITDAQSVMLPGGDSPAITGVPDEYRLDYRMILCWSYLAGLSIFALRFLLQVASIGRMYKAGRRETIRGIRVMALDRCPVPFSFFGRIFVNPGRHAEGKLTEILLHEQVHNRQWHSADVLICECAKMICWFNPFIWLLSGEVRLNLEHLADRGVIRSGCNARNYQYHLLQMSCLSAFPLPVNHFRVTNFKRRVIMMNKYHTSKFKLLKYFLLFPVVAMALVVTENVFANSLQPVQPLLSQPVVTSPDVASDSVDLTKEKIVESADVAPVFPGGKAAFFKFLNENLTYPPEAEKNKITGRVVVRFIISRNGDVSNVKVANPVDPLLDAEAVRLVKSMPKWTPGKQKGDPVNVYFTLPVNFAIKDNSAKKQE